MLGVVDEVNDIPMIEDGDMVVTAYRRTGKYQPRTFARWRTALERGGVAVDIGCYTGIYTIAAALAGCQAYGFDINALALARAKMNAEKNNVFIKLENIAIFRDANEIGYRRANNRDLCSTIRLVNVGKIDGTIKSRQLDTYNFEDVCVIRINSVDSDLRILIGSMHTIRNCKPDIFMKLPKKDDLKNMKYFLDELEYKMVHLDKGLIVWTTGEL